jgi:hypothetical protein
MLAQKLPDDERAAIMSHLAEYDRQTETLKLLERGIAEVALDGRERETSYDDPRYRHGGCSRCDGGHRSDRPFRQP